MGSLKQVTAETHSEGCEAPSRGVNDSLGKAAERRRELGVTVRVHNAERDQKLCVYMDICSALVEAKLVTVTPPSHSLSHRQMFLSNGATGYSASPFAMPGNARCSATNLVKKGRSLIDTWLVAMHGN